MLSNGEETYSIVKVLYRYSMKRIAILGIAAMLAVSSALAQTGREIAQKVKELFDLRPHAIERTLNLRQPMYLETAAYGHMGRRNEVVKKTFSSRYHDTKTLDVELFTWEKLDRVDEIRKAFGL